MMQITEDTPPDMLAGAMDLSVHLPNGKSVKMSVERSTPMLDLLVQITTAHHLQLSNHTLQVLGMAPSSEHNDRTLPFKPNTPIGTLDTQHIRVLPKGRTLPAPKYPAPGHQPFESTFRLKVHLPRNQLYVTRVSRNVLLEDIMKKVCEEKNLDSMKYDFKHPGNLEEVLDPKLTLSDYQITEIYVVAKGTTNPSQAFSAADIMVLRKEEERKQMHNKTGGGVFNLIFKRGKSSMGSGSVSSDNRSISPTHSDDSRSVTPPAVQAPPIAAPPKKDPPPDRPKPPLRKRRPAPKPPQVQVVEAASKSSSSVVSSETASNADGNNKKACTIENGLTICHSRNSSDSSGYHEAASILSDHCANASLPRNRPKSAFVGDLAPLQQGTSNLTKMAMHSKSATSLVAGRKKKIAPPPPPPPLTVSPANSVVTQSENPSPLVASQSNLSTSPSEFPEVLESSHTNPTPIPKPRNKIAHKPLPTPRPSFDDNVSISNNNEDVITEKVVEEVRRSSNNSAEGVELKIVMEEIVMAEKSDTNESISYSALTESTTGHQARLMEFHLDRANPTPNNDYSMEEILTSLEAVTPFIMNTETPNALTPVGSEIVEITEPSKEDSNKPPSIVGMIPKTPKEEKKFASAKDSFGRKRCFKIASSLEQAFDAETASLKSTESKSSRNSVASALNALDDEISDLDENMFSGSLSKGTTKKRPELFGIHDYESDKERTPFRRDVSVASMCSSRSSIAALNEVGLRKWDNSEDLDSISVSSFGVRNRWVAGDASDTESVTSSSVQTPHETIPPFPLEPSISSTPVRVQQQHEEKSLESTDSGIAQDVATSDQGKDDADNNNHHDFGFGTPPPPPILDDIINNYSKEIPSKAHSPETVVTPPPPPVTAPPTIKTANILAKQEAELVDVDWQYQLPSPPKAFRDSSPSIITNLAVHETNNSMSDFKDSVVTSPELFEKLRTLEDNQSETLRSEATSVASEEPLNTLSLEHLEKRKSLVYNRELATSLKMTDSIETSGKTADTFASPLTDFQSAYDNKLRHQPPKPARTTTASTSSQHHTLPNFQITTYDVPKHKNIKVFEDDTIRSSNTLAKREFGSSMENISLTNVEREYTFYKAKPIQAVLSVSRSGSFSTDNNKLPINSRPVSRSKSTLTLNKYQQATKRDETDNMSRSSSLFDVSGLQSLEVMRLIQNKLNSPPESTENINVTEKTHHSQFVPQNPPSSPPKVEELPHHIPSEPPVIEEILEPPPKAASPEPVKKYYYRGPPSINMSTWSERPKIPVAVKEDEDYHNHDVSSKLIVNTINNNVTSNNTLEVRSNNAQPQVSVNVNSTEQITSQKSGNVVIKIGSTITQHQTNRLLGPMAYRKPFANINGTSQRPHSIALASDFDISRVPVVRSVEFKKPYKDSMHNTSITHLNQESADDFKSLHHISYYDKTDDSFAEKFRSTENLRSIEESEPSKRVFRVGSYKPLDHHHHHVVPTVRGFKSSLQSSTSNNNNNNNNDINHQRLSWNPSSTVATNFNTLPAKPKAVDKEEYNTNQHVPFSQSTLRRTGSSKLYCAADQQQQNFNIVKPSSERIISIPPSENHHYQSFNSLPPTTAFVNNSNKAQLIAPPPPPPQMPQVTLRKMVVVAQEPFIQNNNSPADVRDALLESIRNFGGKKGLKAVVTKT